MQRGAIVDFIDRSVTEHVVWMRLRRLSDATVDLRLVALRSLTRSAGMPPLLCAPADLDNWQRGLAVADSSRASYVSQVASFYAWAVEHSLIDEDPSVVLVSPQLPRRVPRPIAEDDLELAMAAAPARIAPWLELAAYGGLRAAEIAYLSRPDVVDRGDSPVLVVRGKGNRERIVPIAPRVSDALRLHGLPDSGYVFRRQDGRPGPNRPNTVTILAAEHLHSLGIPASLHQLRHRFATELYRDTRDLRMVQELLGHSSPTTTALYTAWSQDRAVAAVARLGQRRTA
jgi:integrase